jgi:hypothetical protein
MGAKKIKKKSKNGKSPHGDMICDVVPKKNIRHAILMCGTT